MKCPACGASELVQNTRDLPYTYKGKSIVIPSVTGEFCPACGESILTVPESERVGERERFELHHIKRVTDGGAVYDIDNLRVVTPKHHIEIHRGNK